MAQPINCDYCNENMANVMVSQIAGPEVVAVCVYCALRWGIEVTAQLPESDEMMSAAVEVLTADLASRGVTVAPPAKPRQRGSRGKGGKAQAPAGTAEPAEEATDEPTDDDEPAEPAPARVEGAQAGVKVDA